MLSNKVKGYAAGIIAAVFYGTNPLGTLNLYADGINSGTVLFYRYALAVVIFALWMIVKGENFKIKCGHAIRFALFGSFFALSSTTLYVSFHYMDAGVASTILFCYPIMTAVLMAVFYHEHVTLTTALAIILALGGIALLYQGGTNVRISGTGIALVLLSSLLYALYIVGVNQWKTDYSPLKFTFWIVVFGLLAVLVYTYASGDRLQMLHGAGEWANALQLALMPTVLSLFFMTISIKNIGSTPSAIMGAFEPLTAVAIGVLVFGETFTLRLAIGIILILTGVTLVIAGK